MSVDDNVIVLNAQFIRALRQLSVDGDDADASDEAHVSALLSALERVADGALDADFERVGLSAACIKFGDAFCESERFAPLVERCVALAVRLTPNDRVRRPTHRYEFAVAQNTVAVQLSERQLAASELGAYLYLSGLLLASLLAHHVDLLRDQLVVELGAGRALTSLAAAAADRALGGDGMRRLVITDGEEAIVDNIEQTVAANAAVLNADKISVRRYAFGDAWPDELRAELLIATDVCYELVHSELVARALDAVLAPHGTALIVCGVRYNDVWRALLAELHQRGYVVARAQLDVELCDSGREWRCAARLIDDDRAAAAAELRAHVAALLVDAPRWLDAACRAPGKDLTRLMNCGTFFGSDTHEGGIQLLAVRKSVVKL